ncbi:MAG: hypothetical protein SFV81_07355 [Pirellulaceae bacterium]|nr:hypothetical protein [Pirellulaceae bacterium]
MLELLLESFLHLLFHAAIYVPGICISTLTGRSPQDLSEGQLIAVSIAFWGVIIMLCLVGWAAVSWFRAVV